jgi:transaldolase/glucose-6-phosphate isomerase
MSEFAITLELGPYQRRVTERLRRWKRERFARRLWDKDPALWAQTSSAEISDRLGWLELAERSPGQIPVWSALRDQVLARGFTSAVLLGMGGSSLAPEVFQATFGNAAGHPQLVVLDSTHPQAVLDTESRLVLERSLFIVSSKSGTTIETVSLFRYFFDRLSHLVDNPGDHFIAITDPGTVLEKTGRERGFLAVISAPPDVGGRYSALSAFGLVPACLVGVDLAELLRRADLLARRCGPDSSDDLSPGLLLGAALGELALAGRDKLTLLASPGLESFPRWIEQLVAESTGKNGKGILPVVDEPLPECVSGDASVYGGDRVFVHIGLAREPMPDEQILLAALEAAGHPLIRIVLDDAADLGAEMYRWEVAVAAACSALGVHPFDQPDVELAKKLARDAMAEQQHHAAEPVAARTRAAQPNTPNQADAMRGELRRLEEAVRTGDYFSIQAYLAPDPRISDMLDELRCSEGRRRGIPTTLGYGPRFLHSTGQLHKGGPDTGIFLQLVDRPLTDVAVPESDYTFGNLIAAQSLGDYKALLQRGRRVARLDLAASPGSALRRLTP